MRTAWPHGDPQTVVHAILADPRFTGTTTSAPPQPGLFERFIQWLGEQVQALLHVAGRLLGNHARLDSALGIAVVAAIAVGLVLLAVRLFRLPGRRHASAGAGAAVGLDQRATSAELLERARRAAREERWHDAAAALVQAALRALDERGRLRFDAARTAGEARRLLRDPAFDAFEREATTTLFAAGAATRERFARLDAAYESAFREQRV